MHAQVSPGAAVHTGMTSKAGRNVIGEHWTFAELKAEFDSAARKQDVGRAAQCYNLLASCADGQERYREDTMHRLWGLR